MSGLGRVTDPVPVAVGLSVRVSVGLSVLILTPKPTLSSI